MRPGRTRLVWLETPANPAWQITDIAAAAEIAHRAGACVAVDSTVATPVLTRPLMLGADIVMHSATKYLNGHSDVIAGTLTTRVEDGRWARIKAVRHRRVRSSAASRLGCCCAGCAPSTCASITPAARRSASPSTSTSHPAVAEVLYPGLAGFPGHAVAARHPAARDLHILSTLGGATVANASWQIALSSPSSIPGS